MTPDNSIRDLIEQCGLESTPALVLAQLLTRGSAGAALIAQRAGLKRPTVYAALEGLIQAGLVHRSRKQNRTFFSAVSADVFPELMVDRAQSRFSKVKSAAELLRTQLESHSIDFGGYELSTIENTEDFYRELEAALSGGSYIGIFNPQAAINDFSRPLIERFLRNTAVNRPQIREIMVAGQEAAWYKRRATNPNHLIKELPGGTRLTSDMICYSGMVMIAHYGSNRELAIKIRHQEFYRSMLTLFETMWRALP